MSFDIVPIPRREITRAGFESLPPVIVRAGQAAAWRFIEFFTATIRNRNTRAAYAQAITQFFAWCEKHRIHTLEEINPVVIGVYVETLGRHPHALRFPGDRTNRSYEPGLFRPGSEAYRASGQDTRFKS
jgi:hypothetical protein